MWWLQDRQTFFLKGRPIQLPLLRAMAQGLVAEAERVLWAELLWMEDAESRLPTQLGAIQHDITRVQRGLSFLSPSALQSGQSWIGWPMCQRLAGCISSRSTSYSQSNRQLAAYSRERALYGGTSGVWIGSWSCSAWLLISQVASLLEGFPMVSRYLSYSNSQRNRQLDARRIALQWSDCVRIYLMINRNAPLGERNLGKELNLIC
jgi:hypothetical protein